MTVLKCSGCKKEVGSTSTNVYFDADDAYYGGWLQHSRLLCETCWRKPVKTKHVTIKQLIKTEFKHKGKLRDLK